MLRHSNRPEMCEQKPYPVGDADPEIGGGGGGGGGVEGSQKQFFLPFGPQFGLRIRGAPLGPSGSATAIRYGFRAHEKAIRYSVNIA